MKRLITSLLIASMLSVSTSAFADQLENNAVVTPLVKNQPAPFPGVLFSTDAVAKVISDKQAAEKAKELAVQHQAELDAAQLRFEIDQLTTTCTADKSVLQAQLDSQKNQVKILNDQLQKQTSGPGAVVWIGLGGVGGVVLTVLTVFAVSQAQK